jgi:pyruvate kinase
LIVSTHSGRTALAISKLRYPTPALALSDDAEVARAMALYWGVCPLYCPEIHDPDKTLAIALDWARERSLIASGDRVVLLRGTMPDDPSHNAMIVQEVN